MSMESALFGSSKRVLPLDPKGRSVSQEGARDLPKLRLVEGQSCPALAPGLLSPAIVKGIARLNLLFKAFSWWVSVPNGKALTSGLKGDVG
jgi:hypothetical protein